MTDSYRRHLRLFGTLALLPGFCTACEIVASRGEAPPPDGPPEDTLFVEADGEHLASPVSAALDALDLDDEQSVEFSFLVGDGPGSFGVKSRFTADQARNGELELDVTGTAPDADGQALVAVRGVALTTGKLALKLSGTSGRAGVFEGAVSGASQAVSFHGTTWLTCSVPPEALPGGVKAETTNGIRLTVPDTKLESEFCHQLATAFGFTAAE